MLPSDLEPAARFRWVLNQERPLQVVGVVNAYAARLAEQSSFRALYLSGAGVANACFALPDLGIVTLTELSAEVRRITAATSLPLLVDIDTGFGHRLNVRRCAQEIIRSGAAAVQIEDQVQAKRCGHRPNKELVTSEEMCDRIQNLIHARSSEGRDLVVVARTDAFASEGLEGALLRAQAYVAAGAEVIFAEALTSLDQYQAFAQALSVPVLANCTEFGKTPLFTLEEFHAVGVGLVLYPLTGFRVMNHALTEAYRTLREQGTQKALIPSMQTRHTLYQTLNYEAQERLLDADL